MNGHEGFTDKTFGNLGEGRSSALNQHAVVVCGLDARAFLSFISYAVPCLAAVARDGVGGSFGFV